MDSSVSEAAVRRYRTAYAVASSVAGIGAGVKLFGVFVGLGTAILGFVATKNFAITVAIACAVLGAMIGTFIYILGVLILSLGQTHHAILDVAVNTSPVLGTEAKARLMADTHGEFDAYSATQSSDSLSVVLSRAIAGLDSPDPVAREHAASQLGDLGAAAAGALPKLEVLKRDPVGRVRGRAAWAVEEITRKQRLTGPNG